MKIWLVQFDLYNFASNYDSLVIMIILLLWTGEILAEAKDNYESYKYFIIEI